MSRILLLLVILFCSQLGYPQDAPSSTNSNNPEPTQQISPTDLTLIIEQLESISRNLAADPQAQNRDNEANILSRFDLRQQSEMAKGTTVMAVTAFFGLIISGWGIWLLIKNLRLTNQIIRQDRAWLIFVDAAIHVRNADTLDESVVVETRWINSGNTPALNVNTAADKAFEVSKKVSEDGLTTEVDETSLPRFLKIENAIRDTEAELGAVTGVGDYGKFSCRIDLTKDEFTKALAHEYLILIHVAVSYRDVYKTLRTSEVTFGVFLTLPLSQHEEMKGDRRLVIGHDFTINPLGTQNSCT